MQVLKANGEKEQFSSDKLHASIHRAGIPHDLQATVVEHVQGKLYDGIPTSEIYHHIVEFLGDSSKPYTKAKYNLKQAIMDLGPTGYPFEDYVAKVLEKEGYSIQVRQILQGKCISHEIDVIAEKDGKKLMVEAKFHNGLGIKTDVHVSMYTKARFDDIKEKNGFSDVLLITNTKMTLDAISYAQCVGMQVISWSYPDTDALRDLVDKYHLFPITAITILSQMQKQQLLDQGTVLCSQICHDHNILDKIDLPQEKKDAIFREVEFVCDMEVT